MAEMRIWKSDFQDGIVTKKIVFTRLKEVHRNFIVVEGDMGQLVCCYDISGEKKEICSWEWALEVLEANKEKEMIENLFKGIAAGA